MLNKITITTILKVSGSVLGLAASIVGGIASEKLMKEEVAKQVAEALKNQK